MLDCLHPHCCRPLFLCQKMQCCFYFSVAAMHNPYANHNPTAASVQNHVMGASTGVPDVHKRDKDAIYG